jgi:tetratricopeptide (TPR) repeat protein
MTAVDILDIQSDVALQVAENLKVLVHPEVKERIKARSTENTEAYFLYLQAMYEPYLQSMQMLKRAVSLDPVFADAYATMAYSIMWNAGDSLNREQKIEIVEPLLNKALQLNRNSVVAHAHFAEFKLWFYWDFETAGKEYQIFKQLNPSNYECFSSFSQYLWAVGRSREAYILCEANFKQNKNSHYDWVHMALAYEGIGEKEKALETIETALRLFPHADFVLFRNALSIFVIYGRYEEAIELFEKRTAGSDIHELANRVLGDAGIAYYKSGNKSKANTFLNELLSRTSNIDIIDTYMTVAVLYVVMGENDKALQWLEKAYIKRETSMVLLKYDPHFLPLHGDPRFEDLLVKIGFK